MKKVLVISSVPTPPISAGNQKCILEYCQVLRMINVDVHFLFVQGRLKLENIEADELQKFWGENLHIYKRKIYLEIIPRFFHILLSKMRGHDNLDARYPVGLTNFVHNIHKKEKFSSIIVNYVTLSKLFKNKFNCTKVIYSHDVFSYKKERLNVQHFWFDLTPNEESKGLKRADIILSIQDNESIFFKYLCPKVTVETVFSYFPIIEQNLTYNNNILFLSGKSQLNINGIMFFIKDVWPLIRNHIKNATLCIGGSICDVLKDDYVEDNILFVGRVENENSFYEMGDIVINPVFQGTGLKIKTFEALSHGKITIVHPHSAEGIYKLEKAPVLIGEDSTSFADKVCWALKDKKLRQELSQRSIGYISEMNNFVINQYKKIFNHEDSKNYC